MYLITLSYTSPQSPSFFMARDTLSKKHHISESFISDGTKELRRLNLLDIKYGDLEGKTYNQRLANVYTPKPLYNPQDLKKPLADLEQKHGKEKLSRAIKTAATIFEENNPRTIQALIDLENQYGQAILQEATEKIAQKNVDKPEAKCRLPDQYRKSPSQTKRTNSHLKKKKKSRGSSERRD